MENEVMMNEVMEEAVEAATTSTKGLKNVAFTNIATGVALAIGVGYLAYKGIRKLVGVVKTHIETKRDADAESAATANSTDVEIIE